MTIKHAISIFGSKVKIARALGVSPQAIQQWPDPLNQRRTDEINGAALRLGKIFKW